MPSESENPIKTLMSLFHSVGDCDVVVCNTYAIKKVTEKQRSGFGIGGRVLSGSVSTHAVERANMVDAQRQSSFHHKSMALPRENHLRRSNVTQQMRIILDVMRACQSGMVQLMNYANRIYPSLPSTVKHYKSPPKHCSAKTDGEDRIFS